MNKKKSFRFHLQMKIKINLKLNLLLRKEILRIEHGKHFPFGIELSFITLK